MDLLLRSVAVGRVEAASTRPCWFSSSAAQLPSSAANPAPEVKAFEMYSAVISTIPIERSIFDYETL
jgi:hypothetical protein